MGEEREGQRERKLGREGEEGYVEREGEKGKREGS